MTPAARAGRVRDRPWDVLVVGAGPAGSAAALAVLADRPGARVALLDASAFPRDKACGDGIAPHAVDELDELGASAVVAGFPPVDRLRLRTPSGVEVLGPTRRPNLVVPRLHLDAGILAAACERGAVLLPPGRVRRLALRPGEVLVGTGGGGADGGGSGRAATQRARVVIGADGAGSSVRRLLGIPANPPEHLALAVRGYAPMAGSAAAARPPEQLIHMVDRAWPSYAWSFPVGDGRANVGFGTLRSQLHGRGREWLHRSLAELLPDQPADPSTLRAHHLPLSTWRPRPAPGRVLLAGDAASLVNPLTGEGIYYALLSGRLAGRAAAASLSAGAPDAGSGYGLALRRVLDRHLRHTSVLARLVRHPPLLDAALEVADRDHATFDVLVEIGLGRGLLSPAAGASVLRHYGRRLLSVAGHTSH